MKQKAFLLIAGFVLMLFLYNCKKDTIKSPEEKVILKVKVLEYGTDLALPGAKLTQSICVESGKYGCNTSKVIDSWIADQDGIINITKFAVNPQDILEAEVGSHMKKSEIGFIFDTLIQKSSYDSAVIWLYPTATITFNFKQVNSYAAKEEIRFYMEGLPDNKPKFNIDYPFSSGYIIPGFNETYYFGAYGNVKNRLVGELVDSNYNMLKIIFDETKFISKSATVVWNVNY